MTSVIQESKGKRRNLGQEYILLKRKDPIQRSKNIKIRIEKAMQSTPSMLMVKLQVYAKQSF
nr:unnamed protein product [Callosobruchus analis]